jgi:TRAP-type C4-dicarboxylate transport system permease small subunit
MTAAPALKQPWRLLSQAYDGLIYGLAILCGLLLVFITVAIVVDVVLRNTGFRPMQWVSAVVEYVLLAVTIGASPWLVREKGHVTINSLTNALPVGPRRVLGRATIAMSAALLLLLAWRSGVVGLDEYAARSQDIRSISIPGWAAYAILSAGFTLIATEFLRLLLIGDTQAGSDATH